MDLGRVHGAVGGVDVWREGDGQLRVEQLQALLLGRQAEDLILQPLVLLLQRVQRLEHLHDVDSHLSVAVFLQQQLDVRAGEGDVLRAGSDCGPQPVPLLKQERKTAHRRL